MRVSIYSVFLMLFAILGIQQNGTAQGLLWGISYSNGAVEGADLDTEGNLYVLLDLDSGEYAGPGINQNPVTQKGLYLLKLRSSGAFVWLRTIYLGTNWQRAHNSAKMLDVGQFGKLYLAMAFIDSIDVNPNGSQDVRFSNGSRDYLITSFDTAGNYLWSSTYGGTEMDAPFGLAEKNSTTLLVAGYFQGQAGTSPNVVNSVGGSRDALIMSLSTSAPTAGSINWVKGFGGNGADVAYDVKPIKPTNEMVISGLGYSDTIDLNPHASIQNLFYSSPGYGYTLKLNALNEYDWAFVTNTEEDPIETPNRPYINDSNEIFIVGNSKNGVKDYDPALTVYNSPLPPCSNITPYIQMLTSGMQFNWARTFSNCISARIDGAVIDANGGIIISVQADNNTVFQLDTTNNDTLINTGWTGYAIGYDRLGNYTWRIENIPGNAEIMRFGDTLFVETGQSISAYQIPPPCITSNDTLTQTACDFYTWPLTSQTYTASGTYSDTLTSVGGCDSIATLNLTINTTTFAYDTALSVGPYTWPVTGLVYDTSGTYYDTVANALGCDSITQLTLTVVDSLQISVGASDSIICEGESVMISVSATSDSSSTAFIMKVRTTNPGTTNNNQFQLTGAEGEYNIVAKHIGSGATETFNNLQGQQTLTFSNGPGDYLIEVYPTGSTPFHRIRFANTGDRSKLIEIANWGEVEWSTFDQAFFACDSMILIAEDVPDLSSVNSLYAAFQDAKKFTGHSSMANWDVSTIINLRQLFWGSAFNQNINSWNVSNVTAMGYLFADTPFNQPLNSWDVSNCTSFNHVFSETPFNQDIGSWDVSSAQYMNQMFRWAVSFNQSISSWDISNALNTAKMFENASSFNQDIGNWDVSSVTNMTAMFNVAQSFNQDLSSWCVTNIDSLPVNFSINSALDSANHPVWSTCADLYPSGTVFCNGIPTAVVEVTNPITGKIWMDRNLGASRAAQSPTDSLAYGDLYQWGRGADGHQCRNSATTTTLSSSDQPGHGDFIIQYGYPYLWSSQNYPNLWQGLNGANNPCPIGFRIPSATELSTEINSWATSSNQGAFNSVLKLTAAGFRHQNTSSLNYVGSIGNYWASNINYTVYSQYMETTNNTSSIEFNGRANGYSVRCIKD